MALMNRANVRSFARYLLRGRGTVRLYPVFGYSRHARRRDSGWAYPTHAAGNRRIASSRPGAPAVAVGSASDFSAICFRQFQYLAAGVAPGHLVLLLPLGIAAASVRQTAGDSAVYCISGETKTSPPARWHLSRHIAAARGYAVSGLQCRFLSLIWCSARGSDHHRAGESRIFYPARCQWHVWATCCCVRLCRSRGDGTSVARALSEKGNTSG